MLGWWSGRDGLKGMGFGGQENVDPWVYNLNFDLGGVWLMQ